MPYCETDPSYTASTGFRFAHLLTYLLNPLILPAILFGLLLKHLGAPPGEIIRVVLIGVVFFFVVPLVHVVWMVRSQRAETLEVRARQRRTVPFIVGIASYLVALLLINRTGNTSVGFMTALVGCYAFNTLLLLLINQRWKISLHAAGMAGFFAVLGYVVPFLCPPASPAAFLTVGGMVSFLPLLPLVLWARVRVGAHTVGQVVGGALFGLVIPVLELYLLHQVGIGLPC